MGIEKKYLTGVLWQDFQHTKLITLLEKLKKSKNDGTDSKMFSYAVAFLAMYVNDHFDLEEAYMKEYSFPDTEQHVKEHKAYIKQIKQLRDNHSSYSPDAMETLEKSINEWILNHILKDDNKLGQFIAAKEKEQYQVESRGE
jgi:hemerythrin-like metal-binding protein